MRLTANSFINDSLSSHLSTPVILFLIMNNLKLPVSTDTTDNLVLSMKYARSSVADEAFKVVGHETKALVGRSLLTGDPPKK